MGLLIFDTVEIYKRFDLFFWDVLESPDFGFELYTPLENRTAGFSDGGIKIFFQNNIFFSDLIVCELFLKFYLCLISFIFSNQTF